MKRKVVTHVLVNKWTLFKGVLSQPFDGTARSMECHSHVFCIAMAMSAAFEGM